MKNNLGKDEMQRFIIMKKNFFRFVIIKMKEKTKKKLHSIINLKQIMIFVQSMNSNEHI